MSWLRRIKQTLLGSSSTPPDGNEDPKLDAELGWDRIRQGDLKGAISAFSAEMRRNPSTDAFYGRGVALCMARRYDEAIADLDRSIALEPRHVASLSERGLAYVETGNIPRGLQDYDAAIRIDPSYAPAHINKGSAFVCRSGGRMPLLR